MLKHDIMFTLDNYNSLKSRIGKGDRGISLTAKLLYNYICKIMLNESKNVAA